MYINLEFTCKLYSFAVYSTLLVMVYALELCIFKIKYTQFIRLATLTPPLWGVSKSD